MLILDVEAFRRRIADLQGRVLYTYAFTDYYQRPHTALWDLRTHALRIREHHLPAQPSEVLLTAVEIREWNGLRFKRSRFPEGKVRLYTGDVENCRVVVESLGFVPWLVVHKHDGVMYELPKWGKLVLEHVTDVGWMSELEVEGVDPMQAARVLQRQLEVLGVDRERVSADPVAMLVRARRASSGRRVYFSGSIRGGRSLQPLYAAIVSFLQRRGYEILTAHEADPEVLTTEKGAGLSAAEVYRRDLRWLQECDLVIAEVSIPSLGVGVELTLAQQLGKPVICLCQQEVALSAMVDGNEVLHIIRYRDRPDLLDHLARTLQVL